MRTKKVTITPDQADELELEINEQIEGFDNGKCRVLKLICQKRLKMDVAGATRLVAHVQDVFEAIGFLTRCGDIKRGECEDVIHAYTALETYLGKSFNVKGVKPRKRPYAWTVGY
jgi:hypothetical protein